MSGGTAKPETSAGSMERVTSYDSAHSRTWVGSTKTILCTGKTSRTTRVSALASGEYVACPGPSPGKIRVAIASITRCATSYGTCGAFVGHEYYKAMLAGPLREPNPPRRAEGAIHRDVGLRKGLRGGGKRLGSGSVVRLKTAWLGCEPRPQVLYSHHVTSPTALSLPLHGAAKPVKQTKLRAIGFAGACDHSLRTAAAVRVA